MSFLINLTSFNDKRGCLTVIEKVVPFEIKRVFYIYNLNNEKRGAHRHHKTIQAAVCVSGGCKIYCNNNRSEETFELNDPSSCLIINPEDWHEMYDFLPNTVLLVLASEEYQESDYIFEKY